MSFNEADWQILRKEIEAHVAYDDAEEASKQEMLRAFDDGIRFKRDPTTHFTASALVYSSAGVLLHKHKKYRMWLQPGGHIDADESALTAATRELGEETGIVATAENKIVHLDAHDAGPHRHLDIRYLFKTEPVTPNPPAGESQEVAWIPISHVLATMPAEPTTSAIIRLAPSD